MTNKIGSTINSTTTLIPLLDDQLVDMTFITNFTQMTDKWFYKLISENKFPAPIKLSRSSRWRRSEVEQWMSSRILESRGHS